MKIKLILSVAILTISSSLTADVSVANRYINDARLVGEARLKVLLWNVFDARLYAPGGDYDRSQPFALSLSYLRKLKGKKIVEKTISEMSAQSRFTPSELTQWEQLLTGIIKDVDASTTLTGIRDTDGYAVFYRNGKKVGQIEDRRFTEGFFDIWLGENTSEPKLRTDLIGSSQS